jgi:hypothetical protein
MCVVSMITDYPYRTPHPFYPNDPTKVRPWPDWGLEEYGKWKKLLDAARIFDEATGQPDCQKPEKQKLLEEMQEYFDKKFAELEKKLKEDK